MKTISFPARLMRAAMHFQAKALGMGYPVAKFILRGESSAIEVELPSPELKATVIIMPERL